MERTQFARSGRFQGRLEQQSEGQQENLRSIFLGSVLPRGIGQLGALRVNQGHSGPSGRGPQNLRPVHRPSESVAVLVPDP